MGTRLWPPASTFVSSPRSRNRDTTSDTVSGAWYANGAGFIVSLQPGCREDLGDVLPDENDIASALGSDRQHHSWLEDGRRREHLVTEAEPVHVGAEFADCRSRAAPGDGHRERLRPHGAGHSSGHVGLPPLSQHADGDGNPASIAADARFEGGGR